MQQVQNRTDEESQDIRQLMIGLAVNALLTVFKFVIGTATHCTALVADGFKDLASAARSGLKLGLGHLQRDVAEHKERPRAALHLEKALSLIAFAAITYMGVQSLYGAVKDALDQHDTRYTPALFIISAVSVIVKAYIAYHRRRLGRTRHDEAMERSGRWAAVDSVTSGIILLAAVIDRTWDVDIDPWVGAGIGVLIVVYAAATVLRRRRQRAKAQAG